ncbi:MAG TPA: glycosyltransferase family 39 protein, partial [Ktedonobacterales bacterium]|nr:glycosyltransferase family 39 protein [Ktedonobacterales bacterium]
MAVTGAARRGKRHRHRRRHAQQGSVPKKPAAQTPVKVTIRKAPQATPAAPSHASTPQRRKRRGRKAQVTRPTSQPSSPQEKKASGRAHALTTRGNIEQATDALVGAPPGAVASGPAPLRALHARSSRRSRGVASRPQTPSPQGTARRHVIPISRTHAKMQGNPPRRRRALAALRRNTPDWILDWRFWLILGLAALLRLWPLARSPFTSDDALLMLEAARAAHDHTLPATGIFNSLLALNMPFYTWLLLPFAAQPLGMAIPTGVANVLTVAGIYLFGAHYFGRTAGLIAGLLYATATYPTWMSLFIWQQTLVPPLLLATLWTLYLGLVDGKRHWLAPHALLLAALVQVYPLTITLAPLTLLAMALRWRSVHWLDVPLALAGVALLFTPTYLFERASNNYDVRVYQAYLHTPAHIDGQVFTLLGQAIGALPSDYLGAGTPYAAIAPQFGWLGSLLLALWGVSALAMVVSLPVSLIGGVISYRSRKAGRATSPSSPISQKERGRTSSRPISSWRARLPLVLWSALFLAVTVRHASPIYIHYAYILTPVVYLTIGWALAQLTRLPRTLGWL